MAAKQVTITLTDEQQDQLKSINRTRNYTMESLMDIVVERGIYALGYRTKYNAKKQAEIKEFRAWKAENASAETK